MKRLFLMIMLFTLVSFLNFSFVREVKGFTVDDLRSLFSPSENGPKTPPNAPKNVRASIDSGGIAVAWDDNSDNEDGFEVYILDAKSNDSNKALARQEVGRNYSIAVIKNFNKPGSYSISVSAFNKEGSSEEVFGSILTIPTAQRSGESTTTAKTPPNAPKNVRASINSGDIIVAWDDNSDNSTNSTVNNFTVNIYNADNNQKVWSQTASGNQPVTITNPEYARFKSGGSYSPSVIASNDISSSKETFGPLFTILPNPVPPTLIATDADWGIFNWIKAVINGEIAPLIEKAKSTPDQAGGLLKRAKDRFAEVQAGLQQLQTSSLYQNAKTAVDNVAGTFPGTPPKIEPNVSPTTTPKPGAVVTGEPRTENPPTPVPQIAVGEPKETETQANIHGFANGKTEVNFQMSPENKIEVGSRVYLKGGDPANCIPAEVTLTLERVIDAANKEKIAISKTDPTGTLTGDKFVGCESYSATIKRQGEYLLTAKYAGDTVDGIQYSASSGQASISITDKKEVKIPVKAEISVGGVKGASTSKIRKISMSSVLKKPKNVAGVAVQNEGGKITVKNDPSSGDNFVLTPMAKVSDQCSIDKIQTVNFSVTKTMTDGSNSTIINDANYPNCQPFEISSASLGDVNLIGFLTAMVNYNDPDSNFESAQGTVVIYGAKTPQAVEPYVSLTTEPDPSLITPDSKVTFVATTNSVVENPVFYVENDGNQSELPATYKTTDCTNNGAYCYYKADLDKPQGNYKITFKNKTAEATVNFSVQKPSVPINRNIKVIRSNGEVIELPWGQDSYTDIHLTSQPIVRGSVVETFTMVWTDENGVEHRRPFSVVLVPSQVLISEEPTPSSANECTPGEYSDWGCQAACGGQINPGAECNGAKQCSANGTLGPCICDTNQPPCNQSQLEPTVPPSGGVCTPGQEEWGGCSRKCNGGTNPNAECGSTLNFCKSDGQWECRCDTDQPPCNQSQVEPTQNPEPTQEPEPQPQPTDEPTSCNDDVTYCEQSNHHLYHKHNGRPTGNPCDYDYDIINPDEEDC